MEIFNEKWGVNEKAPHPPKGGVLVGLSEIL